VTNNPDIAERSVNVWLAPEDAQILRAMIQTHIGAVKNYDMRRSLQLCERTLHAAIEGYDRMGGGELA
jgi:hypothetical protein